MMKTSLLLFMFLGCTSIWAQGILFPYEENFEWQVKQVDEFIDRFNNADYTPIRNYLKEEHDIDSVNRAELISSLFNLEKEDWSQTDITDFLSELTDSVPPPYLNFFDHDWYAALECQGRYQGKTEYFTLILSIRTDPPTPGSRWVIEAVDSGFLQDKDTTKLLFALGGDYDKSKTLGPASFGTDFMELVDALKDTANLEGYVIPNPQGRPLIAFLNKLYSRDLVFEQVNEITYHFLQIRNWIFQVQDFHRETTNSGWLINSLMAVSEDQKGTYREQVLYLK
ncbi:MAG: hypothetical protein RIG62_00565 [Cyclobacteriaceae bacterium]